MSMILYHGEPNGPSLSVLATLHESGVEAECRLIDLASGARHTISGITEPLARDMGVEGEGPVLVVDGEAMTESVFIAQYLDEIGANTLQPKEAFAHWQMLMWCRRITERCAPAAAFLGCRSGVKGSISADPATIKSDDLRARWAAVEAGDFPQAQVDDSLTKVRDAASLVEQQLSDGREWLMGPLTIADFETYGWLVGMPDLVPDAFTGKVLLNDWFGRVGARPSVQNALSRSQSAMFCGSWAPGPEINRWG